MENAGAPIILIEKLNNEGLPEIAVERRAGRAKVEVVNNSLKSSWAFSRVAMASLRMVSSRRSNWTDRMVILALSAAAPDFANTLRISLATYVLLRTMVSNLVVNVQGTDAMPELDGDTTGLGGQLLGGWFSIRSHSIVGPTLDCTLRLGGSSIT